MLADWMDKFRSTWKAFRKYPRRLQVYLVSLVVFVVMAFVSVEWETPEFFDAIAGAGLLVLIVWLVVERLRQLKRDRRP